jgi:hypothetical protein
MTKCKLCKHLLKHNFCSNVKCKSWTKYRKQAANSKYVEPGLTSDNPIIVMCYKCDNISTGHTHSVDKGITYSYGFCCGDHAWFPYDFIEGKWYQFADSINKHRYVQQYVGAPNWWQNRIRMPISPTNNQAILSYL